MYNCINWYSFFLQNESPVLINDGNVVVCDSLIIGFPEYMLFVIKSETVGRESWSAFFCLNKWVLFWWFLYFSRLIYE